MVDTPNHQLFLERDLGIGRPNLEEVSPGGQHQLLCYGSGLLLSLMRLLGLSLLFQGWQRRSMESTRGAYSTTLLMVTK